jgi:hypothetical protein
MSEGDPCVLPVQMDFQLKTTATAWDCLMRCWASGVFLHQLTHRDLWISLFSFRHLNEISFSMFLYDAAFSLKIIMLTVVQL